MTIVGQFDPRNGRHLRAWRKFEVEYPENPHGAWRNLAATFGLSIQDDWPDDWGPLIIAKMANAWLEEQLGGEPDEDTDAAFDAAFGSARRETPT